jgi:hypothetical protein
MSPPSTAMRVDGGDGLAATVMRVQDEWEDLRR